MNTDGLVGSFPILFLCFGKINYRIFGEINYRIFISCIFGEYNYRITR